MHFNKKSREIDFHADRTYESTVKVVQSVIHDPRISIEQKIELLTKLSGIHVEVVNTIHTAIEAGCEKAVQEVTKEQISLEL